MKLRAKLRTSLLLCALGLLVLLFLARWSFDPTLFEHSREAVLKTDLRILRDAINNYTLDKNQQPHCLRDLVDAGYLRAIPMDPLTHKADWALDFESPVLGDPVLSPDLEGGRLVGVHSSSNQISRDGSKYSKW